MWTGKTPMTLLSEFVQKQPQWQKPDYNVQSSSKDNSRFRCHVRLRKQDKKQGLLVVDYKPKPQTESETVVEAKHMAATYVLHRLRNNTSTHKLLPPVYRDYWLSLDQDGGDGDWRIGEMDPFGAKLRRDKERKEQEDKRNKAERAQREGRVEDLLDDRMRKRWMQLPRVEMSQECRERTEEVVKTWTGNWQMSERSEDDKVEAKLLSMGFRQQHIDEALETVNSASDALQWLSIHVPEDDLPKQILDHKYQSTLVVGSNSNSSKNSREREVKQLMAMGFSRHLSQATLETEEGLLPRAAVHLIYQLCQLDLPQYKGKSQVEEEVEALRAIYEANVRQISAQHIRIKVGVVWLEVWIPPDMDYPDGTEIPAIGVTSDSVPAYIRLHITRQLNRRLSREGGMPVIFDAVCVLEENIETWMQNTPKLSELLNKSMLQEEPAAEEIKEKPKAKRTQRATDVDKQHWIRDAQKTLAKVQKSKEYLKMKQQRDRLPAAKLAERILSLLDTQQVVVVAGATGSGKSTQVPQFILDASILNSRYVRILCSQPRRISAIGVANRVMEERTSKELVGYAVRGETQNNTDRTGLLFVTVGVLLRMVREDPLLESITHVVVDEVHERSVDCDLLLGLLRQTLRRRPDLKVVLMSATAECHQLVEYLGTGSVVQIEGRTYPVDDVFLDDLVAADQKEMREKVLGKGWHQKNDEDWRTALSEWEARQTPEVTSQMLLMVQAVLDTLGGDVSESVLVFVPGVSEIDQLIKMLSSDTRYHVLPLHSSLPAQQQRLVFQHATGGRRKVVVSTDIAETSITIDDIVYVIDLGRVRELRTKQLAFARVSKLATVWCSRAAAQQRRGRAGRTQPGVCYRMYTRQHQHQQMAAQAVPEILRTPVEQTSVAVKSMGYNQTSVLLDTLRDPPSAESVEQAEHLLVVLGLIDAVNGGLTGMGQLVAQVPVDLRLAKILVVAAVLGVTERVIELVAMMGLDKPLFKDTGGWIEDLRIWEQIQKQKGQASRKAVPVPVSVSVSVSYVARQEMKRSIRRLRECLERLGLRRDSHSGAAADDTVLSALIWAGMNPNLARVWKPPPKYKQLAGGTTIQKEDSSAGSGAMTFHAVDLISGEGSWMDSSKDDHRVYLPRGRRIVEEDFGFVCFSGLWATGDGRTRMLDVCVPNTYGLLMFGPPLQVDHRYRTVSMGRTGRATWQCWPRIAYLCQQLRRLLDELVRRTMDDSNLQSSVCGHPVVRLVLDLIMTNGQN